MRQRELYITRHPCIEDAPAAYFRVGEKEIWYLDYHEALTDFAYKMYPWASRVIAIDSCQLPRPGDGFRVHVEKLLCFESVAEYEEYSNRM